MQKTTLADGKLDLTFSQSELQSFFDSKSVYKYEKAFPGTNSNLLKRVYHVITDESNINEIVNLNPIDFIEEIADFQNLYYPDDFFVNQQYENGFGYLNLIRAPLAWEITTGNPNVLIGIVDNGWYLSHEDLVTEITQHIGSSAALDGHGTKVAGYASATTDNDLGISSIGFNTKLLTASGSTMRVHQVAQLPGVRVINTAWISGCTFSEIDNEAYREVWEDFGVVVVSAAGNGTTGNTCYGVSTSYVYPAAYNYTIAVSSVGANFPIGYVYTNSDGNDYTIEWNDCHQNSIDLNNPEAATHQHNDKIDIVAPGYALHKGLEDNGYGPCWGTSCASPIVSGAASLIISIKPELTPDEVRTILKNTADDIYWIPYNQPYLGLLGTGRLNAFRAVKTVQCMQTDPSEYTVDFMIKDSREDVGTQPNNNTEYMWVSSDILVRNQNDGKLTPVHQNPEYDAVNPNYVYVRVTNLGCQTSSGTDTVKVNWAKANTSLNYPEYWNGDIEIDDVMFGGEVGTGIIPPLEPGQEALVEIPWMVPNPADYEGINENIWHFCLLAEIQSPDDPLTSPYTSNPNHMVRNNNNLAWKNVTVVDVMDDGERIGGTIAVTNPSDQIRTFFLEMVKEDIETGKPIYEEAEVGLEMDEVLYAAWERGGKTAQQVDSTINPKKKIVKGNHVILDNIQFNPRELGTLYVSFNFLTRENTDKEKYRYHIIQKDANTGEVMGGETFVIQKKQRNIFLADAGDDKDIDKNESVTLTAEEIFEAAIYNWYDEDGNLVYTGKDFTVSPKITKKYKLEVIAEDGFKDYAEVQVNVTPYKLISLLPNPATNQVNVDYDIENASSAYLMITNLTNATSNNYVLDLNSTSTSINLNNFQVGNYSVTLICDGQIVESFNLIKN